MSYKFTGGHDPPTLPSTIKDSAENQEVLAEEAMSHQQVPRERDPRDADVRACFLEMYQEMSNSEIDDFNSKIADIGYTVTVGVRRESMNILLIYWTNMSKRCESIIWSCFHDCRTLNRTTFLTP
jgi:hypothetical protein